MGDVAWLDPDEQRTWRGLLAAQARLRARLEDELVRAHGISLGDYAVLVNLSETPGRSMRMAELASRLALSPSGLTRRIDGLVRQAMVARQACPSDGRGSLAVLTDIGLARLADAAATHVAGVRRYLIDPLAGPALAALAAGIAAVEEALDGGGIAADPDQGPDQRAPGPVTTSPPRSIQPFVPPATETAR